MSNGPSVPELPAAAMAALRRGSKIEAIKIVREELRIGLKEAKDLVDAVPIPRASDNEPGNPLMRGEASGSGKVWLIVLAIAVAVAIFFWLR